MLNEDKEIQRILMEGFKNGMINGRELRLVAKHYIWNEECSAYKAEKYLEEFCSKWDRNYNEVRDRKMIKNAVNNAKKSDIRTGKIINVTKKELETIESLKNFKFQKLAFVMLVLSKAYHSATSKNYYFSWDNANEVINFSKIRMSVKKFVEFVGVLYDNNMVEFPQRGRREANYIILKYVCDDGEVAFSVDTSNEDEIVQSYISNYGGEIIYCSVCGKPVVKKSRGHKYCEGCWREKYEIINRSRQH